jgi:hypothetical protein
MDRLIIPLTDKHRVILLDFFLANPRILHAEHYFHTRSPLDNLEHYIWEELHEVNHVAIRQSYNKNGYLTDADINIWIDQELEEKGQQGI